MLNIFRRYTYIYGYAYTMNKKNSLQECNFQKIGLKFKFSYFYNFSFSRINWGSKSQKCQKHKERYNFNENI